MISFKYSCSRFKVQGSRFKVQGSRFKVQGSKFKVQGSRFKVQGSRYQPNSRIESIWQRFEMELDGAMQEGQSYLLQYVIVTSFTLRKALTWLHQ
jgi:hypothetical protein